MQITPFGAIFLPIVAGILVLRRGWLLSLLIVSATLHVPAVIVIGGSTQNSGVGTTPWLVASVAIFIHLCLHVFKARALNFGGAPVVKGLLLGWAFYAGWGVLSAFVLPVVFEGLPVFSLGRWEGFDGQLESLKWRPINAIQAVNLSIMWMLFLYIVQVGPAGRLPRQVTIGFVCAGVLSVFLGIYQRFILQDLLAPLALIQNSINPGYEYSLGSSGLPIFRAIWPFTEPSYASVWFSAVGVGGLGLVLFSTAPLVGFVVMLAGFGATLNTFGGSGMAGAAVGSLVLVLFTAWKAMSSEVSIRRQARRRLFLVASLLLIPAAIGIFSPKIRSLSVDVAAYVTHTVAERMETNSNKVNVSHRSRSNAEALRILTETYGMGSGLGSNRASSYLFSMASNVGAVGVVIFLALLIYQMRLLLGSVRASAISIFILSGSLAMFFGISIGIPDLNWPAWWIWVLGSFALIVGRQSDSPRALISPQPHPAPPPNTAVSQTARQNFVGHAAARVVPSLGADLALGQ